MDISNVVLLYLLNGAFIVGTLKLEAGDKIYVAHAHELKYRYDQKKRELLEYEFAPYLEQFSEGYEESDEPTVMICKAAICSMSRPAAHLTKHFQQILAIKFYMMADENNREDLLLSHMVH